MADRLVILDRSLRLLGELVAADRTAISEALLRSPVLINASSSALEEHPVETQTALATLVNLLVRSGQLIQLDLPSASVSTALLAPGPLISALVQLGDQVLPGSVAVNTGAPCDIALLVGRDASHKANRVIHMTANGDSAGFDSSPSAWSPSDPLVALAAAGLVSGESVRHAVRQFPPRAHWGAAALRPVLQAQFGLPSYKRGPIDLLEFDLISAGAITDSLIWTLRARGQVFGSGRVFDDGVYDLTNLNRYPGLDLAAATAGASKALRLASRAPQGLAIEAVQRRFSDQDVADAARLIIVGADDVAVRLTAQQAMPNWLGIAATSHNEVRVTEHVPDGACAGCAHPHLGVLPHDPIPTIAPVSFWAGFVLAVRLLRFASGGRGPADDGYATYYPLITPGLAEVGPCQFHSACPLSPSHRSAA
jgi:hypothetical protein